MYIFIYIHIDICILCKQQPLGAWKNIIYADAIVFTPSTVVTQSMGAPATCWQWNAFWWLVPPIDRPVQWFPLHFSLDMTMCCSYTAVDRNHVLLKFKNRWQSHLQARHDKGMNAGKKPWLPSIFKFAHAPPLSTPSHPATEPYILYVKDGEFILLFKCHCVEDGLK